MSETADTKEYDFEATLIFVVKNGKVLLAPKIEKICAGFWNGYGGKVEDCDPSVEFRATLELWQESDGMICADEALQKVAICYFANIKADGKQFVCKVHVYLVEKSLCTGTPRATKEMGTPKWFTKPPVAEMAAADRHWLPLVLAGKKIIVKATMKNYQSELVGKVEIVEVDSF